MKKQKIEVFQDDNANWTFIVGTSEPIEAKKALKDFEDSCYSEEEKKTYGQKFSDFSACSFYIRGEKIYWDKDMIPKGRGRIAVREGFMAPIE